MNVQIPGYYYDIDKKKYFKIENGKTAPSSAAWSDSNVKRRQLDSHDAEVRREQLAQIAARVRRSRLLNEPLTGGFLGRETGQTWHSYLDTQTASWAQGLRSKGSIWLDQPDATDASYRTDTVSVMYIGNNDTETGLGIAYGAIRDEPLMKSYIPRDAEDEVNFYSAHSAHRNLTFMAELAYHRVRQVSSVTYHESTHNMLLTSREPFGETGHIGLHCWQPLLAERGNTHSTWLAEGDSRAFYMPASMRQRVNWANTCTPAPAASSLVCVVGTAKGIVKLVDDRLHWLTNPQGAPNDGGSSNRLAVHGEIFSLDFLAQNPADVILAGGRSCQVTIVDMRTPEHEWTCINHLSSVAHVHSVGAHQILAAGPRSAMAIYDIRYHSKRTSQVQTQSWDPQQQKQQQQQHKKNKNPPSDHSMGDSSTTNNSWLQNQQSTPLLTFSGYRNDAHLQIGLDILPENGGIVAAAHDDKTVALYSLRDGKRLPSPAVDAISAPGVVKSISFKTLPGDRNASLFVGDGPHIKKYSFGTRTPRRAHGKVEIWEE
ncbi:hypothetical protein B0T17DRAFT_515246 [Bombardia bombarda]|uniref:Uncharacterized protein n=1 Tax=Bombardia bombarda TaxID=252184 RepID=A0AA39XK02_9PEZI|nr:hypothetical protein B0T17DRAFT_515246 [Bombardia bombarda]